MVIDVGVRKGSQNCAPFGQGNFRRRCPHQDLASSGRLRAAQESYRQRKLGPSRIVLDNGLLCLRYSLLLPPSAGSQGCVCASAPALGRSRCTVFSKLLEGKCCSRLSILCIPEEERDKRSLLQVCRGGGIKLPRQYHGRTPHNTVSHWWHMLK